MKTTDLVQVTTYQGYDIVRARGKADWWTVVDRDTEHYFVGLRAAMDYCDAKFNKQVKI